MKKFFNLLCLAAFTTSIFVACSKNDTSENLPVTNKKTVSFNAKSADTKTYFGDKTDAGYPTVWSENQDVKISLNYGGAKDATVTPSSNGKTASFTVTIDDDQTDEYTFYALSPASSCVAINSQYKSWNVLFPTTQKPINGSVDEAAHIMVAQSATFTTFPEETTPVTLAFSHIAAYGKFQFRNFPETVTIQSIELTAQEDVAGRFYFYPETGELSANSAGKSVILDVSEYEIDKNNTTDFWFSFAPVNLEGKTLKVSVHTDAGVYAKTITFPSGKGNFQAGRVASFTINMNGITPGEDHVYRILTDKNQLLPGAKAIIVAKDAAMAISTTQNPNNRGITSVTKSTDHQTITNPADAVQIFTLEAGTIDNTVAFKCENGDQADNYIGGVSTQTGNYMRSFGTKADNTSFNVSIEEGYTVLKANNTTDRNYVRYNAGSSCISCYASTSAVIAEVVIYVLEGSGEGSSLIGDPKCPTPEISFNSSDNTVTITCTASGARIGYTTDGTDPGIDDDGNPTGTTQEYTEPFVITETCTVKAFAGASGYEMSEIAEKECVVSSGVDYVTLDWSVPEDGGSLTSSVLNNIPGVTTNGLGTDYAAGNAPYQVKLDNSGDYIQVKTDDAIGYVAVDYKMIGGNVTSSLRILESTDGTTWSDVENLTISGAQNDTGTLETSNYFASSSRYVKIVFTKGSNVGIGGITISKDAPTPVASYNITINNPSNGSISSSVETAKEGTVVTLTATPNSGYVFSEWDVKDASNNPITVTSNQFTMPASDVTVSAVFEKEATAGTTATITFSSSGVAINKAVVTGDDDQENTWTITTEGTTSFTSHGDCYQVGSASKPATSITFTTTLPSSVNVKSFSAKFGGYSGTAGDVELKVGDTVVGTGALNATNDVTVQSTVTASGTVLTVTVTNIAKGVKVYNIIVTYE